MPWCETRAMQTGPDHIASKSLRPAFKAANCAVSHL
jgi:hypothetical protein